MASKKTYELDEVGVMAPDQRKVDSLQAGEVGYLAASIKAVADARVGDTITLVNNPLLTGGYVLLHHGTTAREKDTTTLILAISLDSMNLITLTLGT